MDLNSVSLVGRLTRDCDVRYTTSGVCVGRFAVACNRMKKGEVDYFDVSIFGKLAENLKFYLSKGKQVAISGRLQQDRWTDKEDRPASRIGIVADNVQLLGGASQPAAQPQQTQQSGYTYNPPPDPFTEQDYNSNPF